MPHTRGAILRPATWTLRTKLVVAVLSLFTVVTLLVAAVTVGAVQRYLTNQLIDDVRSIQTRTDLEVPVQTLPRPGQDRDNDGPRGIPGGSADQLLLGLTASGQIAQDHHGAYLNSVINREGAHDTLDDAQVAALIASRDDDEAYRVNIGGDVGTYLVISTRTQDGGVLFVGLPTRGVDGVVRTLLELVLGGLVLGLIAMWLGGTYLIRRNLEPLNRVSAVAQRVSSQRLHQGKVALAERVEIPEAEAHTEVGEVGTALNTLLDNVESALVAREASESKVRQFVADASHELRTPLASIRGYAELSRREPEPVPASVAHAMGRVESEAVRMQGLVEDLLLLARLDAGRPLARDEVDLSRIVMDTVGDAHVAARDHAWTLDLPEDPVLVVGDEARLRQVLVNLLGNARTHTPAGSTVVTALRTEGATAVMTVTDNGPGIPAEFLPTIFERFTRGDESRNRASGTTGLGLSIVSAVVHAHAGQVTVTSHPGQTQFQVTLPLA